MPRKTKGRRKLLLELHILAVANAYESMRLAEEVGVKFGDHPIEICFVCVL